MKSRRALSRRLLFFGLVVGGLWEFGLGAGRLIASIALAQAVATGTNHEVRTCLFIGADPNFTIQGVSMLGYALRNRDPSMRYDKLDALLKAGADPTQPSGSSDPLRSALRRKDWEAIRRLQESL